MVHSFHLLLSAFHLLQLLSHDSILHPSSHHSKEETGNQRADVEGHPRDGVSEKHLSSVPVHRSYNLVGQGVGAHTVSCQLAGDVWWQKNDEHTVQAAMGKWVIQPLPNFSSCVLCTSEIRCVYVCVFIKRCENRNN